MQSIYRGKFKETSLLYIHQPKLDGGGGIVVVGEENWKEDIYTDAHMALW